MDQSNFRHMLLAYHAVHDEVLCESMDELGFFDEQEQLNEVSVAMKRRAAEASAAKAEEADQAARKSRRGMSPSAPYVQMMSDRATAQHRRLVKAAYPNPKGRRKKVAEEYDLFDVVLEHLIDEGYTDSLEGAEAIMANMSDEWLEDIIEARDGYGGDEKFNKPDDKLKPGTDVPAPKTGGYGRISRSIPYGIGAHATRTQSRVTSISGDDPGEARARKLPTEEKPKPKRVIPAPDRSNREPKATPKRVIPRRRNTEG